MGPITMSRKEARRPGLVEAALKGKITNREGAAALGMSVRQFRRLRGRYRTKGVQGLLHGNRGRSSSRRLSAPIRERVVALLRTTYAGFNDHHFTEKLREVEKLRISREAVRQIRQAAQITPVRRRRPKQYRARRLREARPGALVLLDGSTFAWFGPEEPLSTLLGAIDDATGEILALHFRPHEDLHGYTELLRRMARSHGLPVQLYGDRLNIFVRNDACWTLEEELAGVQNPTHFGTMLRALAIGYIPAGSPQAKGRIERLWRTLQDRLVSELRLRCITTREAGEGFLPLFLPDFNQRFALAPRESTTAWRCPPSDLAQLLACRYSRVVARDNTVSIPGRWAQIPPGPSRRSYQGCRVTVREQLDGGLLVFHQDQLIATDPPPPRPFTLMARDAGSSGRRRRALGLDRPKPLRVKPVPFAAAPVRLSLPPGPNHPWRTTAAALSRRYQAAGGRTKSRGR